MKNCSPGDILATKGDRLSLLHCPKNDYQKEKTKDIPYVFAVGSLMYAHVCNRPDIVYAVGKHDRYL